MATTEKTGLLTHIDASGNKTILYPATIPDAVDGLAELLAAKAPAGFGLGGNGQPITISALSEIDNIKENGQYAVHATSAVYIGGVATSNFTLEVSMFTSTYGHQTVKLLGYNTTLRRDCNNGVWGEFEWDNPPMYPGVEYRTTKRHNGAAVYTKLLSYSPGSFATQDVKLAHEISNLDVGLSINVSWLMNGVQWRHFPSVYHGDNKWNGQVYWYGNSQLSFELGATLVQYMGNSSKNILVTVEYTKTA